MVETLQTQLYLISQFANTLVTQELSHLNWLSVGFIFSAGLLTSLTPCMLSMLPITIGYIGGYEAENRWQGLAQSSCFALGLATTLAALGMLAAIAGNIYGQIGFGLPILVSILAILMGLNLLQALPVSFPSFNGLELISKDLPKGIQAYLVGLTFGLVASPCSTPVLATLLVWASTLKDPWLSGVLFLAYTVCYVFPLILAGTFTAGIKRLLAVRQWSGWITPTSGVLLIGFGVFSLMSRF